MLATLKEKLPLSRETVVSFLLNQGLRRNWPIIVAVAWRVAMQPSHVVGFRRFRRKKLVVIAKSAGNQDVENAFLSDGPRYQVLFLPRQVVAQSGRHWLQERVSDISYQSADPQLENDKAQYRHHLRQVLIWFDRIFGLSAIAQFNILYWAERELSAACVELGFRFVAIHKECNWSPAVLNQKINLYATSAGLFEGSAISVYNNKTKEIFLAAGIANSSQIYVSGCARADESHRLRSAQNLPQGNTVLFYMIDPTASLPRFKDERTGCWKKGVPASDFFIDDWSEMVSKVNQAIIELAECHKDTFFICKAKEGFQKKQKAALLDATPLDRLPENIELITNGIGHKLLPQASLVIGFNTTAVLEAMAAGIPVIVPNIFSERESRIVGYAHDINDGAMVPTSQLELKSMVLKIIGNPIRYCNLTSGQEQVLDFMLGNSDGKAGMRLRSFLDKAVYGDL